MKRAQWLVIGLAVLVAAGAAVQAAEVKLALVQNRVAYQTNEEIRVAVERTNNGALPAGVLAFTIAGNDGSKLSFTFPAKALPDGRGVEHISINAALLRPGTYNINAAVDGATASAAVEIYSHVRRSTYRLVHWGSPAAREQQALMGEDGAGFNLLMNQQQPTDDIVRAGVDFMGNCLMGGMHQHDGRLECDWSDPLVTGGAVQRAMVRTYPFRTWGNAIGAHLHDEPGLTWGNHPHTGQMGPHDIQQQRDAFQRAFGTEQIWYDQVDAKNPDQLAQWMKAVDFKQGFMEAFWRQAYWPMQMMKPGFLAVTQSQYGWYSLTDGYYFNVARSMPVICGHGGYDDHTLRQLNPSYYLEYSLARQLDKPTWYLPEWFDGDNDTFRAEHYLSFVTGINGLCAPPGAAPWNAPKQRFSEGLIEANKTMAALGTVFAKPPISRNDLAILYSKSSAEFIRVADKQGNGSHDGEQIDRLALMYLASKMAHYPFTAVVDEDVLDGTLAANHKAVVLTGIRYLDPAVKAGLEEFAAGGGAVLMTDDCAVPVTGAQKLGPLDRYAPLVQKQLAGIQDAEKKKAESRKLLGLEPWMKHVAPMAKSLAAALAKAGIKPAFETDAPGLAPGRQVRGEIEYVFAVNFTPGGRRDWPSPSADCGQKAIDADVSLAADGRAVYDAVRGGSVPEFEKGSKGQFRFGPGQMRAFAITARPIGSVQVRASMAQADFTRPINSLAVEISATLLDKTGGLLAGNAPMQVTVIDPLGNARYSLYRAAELGLLRLELPLAMNDPAGNWTVSVRDLLAGTEGTAKFAFSPAASGGAVAGEIRRAVMYPADRDAVYSLFQQNHTFTIVKGTGDDVAAAAQRLADSLKPYDVFCTIVDAAAVKVRQLTPAEVKTWTSYGGGADPNNNSPYANGYDLKDPAILIGNVENNPVMALVAKPKAWHPAMPSLMPYEPSDAMPGPGRGMVAWHMYVLGRRLQSVTLLANDAAGLNEAVGTLFEIVAGLEPLTPNALPATSVIVAATQKDAPPALAIAWQVVLPDRPVTIAATGNALSVQTWDGSQTAIDAKGRITSGTGARTQKKGDGILLASTAAPDPKTLPKGKLAYGRLPKLVAPGNNATAVGYWGGTLQTFDAQGGVKSQQVLPQDISAMAWLGDILVVGLADGRVVALK